MSARQRKWQTTCRFTERTTDLPKAEKEYLLVLGRGAKTCNKSIPDVLQRAKFLEKGGADTVAAVGM
ncbi:MAG: hypothetical protein LBH00_07680, partial [Planctomycetaceae bacterium]|nr:hypothetical protein [Planctomycetaceae bacterium]